MASSSSQSSVDGQRPKTPGPFSNKGRSFWLLFLALCVAEALSALDALVVATALPTIVNDLHGKEFVWVGSAFTLASTAFLPWTGTMANVWGRKPVMIAVLLLFGAGSAICGAAPTMDALIAGRTVQGIGSGGILSLVEIIISDLVPLRDRGPYFGIIGSVWAIASAIGPPVGGALASASQWRWAFYMNLPITAVALILVYVYLDLPSPKDNWQDKLERMDWVGNILIICGTSATILALSWGGSSYPWSSYQVLVPLIIGLATLALAIFYEARYSTEPTIPFAILSDRSALSGYIGAFMHGIIITTIGFYLTVYFQAVHDDNALEASIQQFPTAFSVAPFAILVGASVSIWNCYVPQNWLGWIFLTAGVGSFASLGTQTSQATWIGLQILTSAGFGALFPAANFTILAPLKPSQNAHALAFFTFIRTFASTWGITIGSTIIQNELSWRIPAAAGFGSGGEAAYAAIPLIPALPDDVRAEVHEAYAAALRVVWQVMTGISGIGLLSVFMMREIPLATDVGDDWAEEKAGHDEEKKSGGAPEKKVDQSSIHSTHSRSSAGIVQGAESSVE